MGLVRHVRLGQPQLPTNLLELPEATNRLLSQPDVLMLGPSDFVQEARRSNVSTISKSGVRFDYSGIFQVKEEFIFVFSGYSSQGLLSSVEVFDTQRELWHIFGHLSGFEADI